MSEPNGPWRLLYKNDSDVNTVLGVMGDIARSAYRLKQARWKPRARAAAKISFIAEKNIYKNIPQSSSDFGTSESAIFWQGFRFNKVIQAVDTSTDTFTVSGDVTNDFEEGGAVEVNGSSRTDENTIYKVQSPSDVTYDSNNDETNITVVEDVTDSTVDGNLEGYENIFRGFAQNQGKITENGNVKFTLFSFLKRISQENVTISSTSDIQDVMSKLTPNDYTFDSPASSNVTYVDSTGATQTGYAPVDDYSLTDVDRAVGFREKIRNYGYVVKLKAHKELRFEPVGFGSSIDTIDSPAEGDTNNTRGNWIEWVAGDTNVANLVNTVRVVNSKNGKYDSGIITNSSSVQKHGKITPKGGNPVKKGYVSSDQEAKRVAQNIIRDSQNPDEGGRVKIAGRFTNDVTNSTFTLNDSVRGINSETFVAWSQVNFYPENKTILEFEYENQSEKETNITDDVRAERSTVFSDQTTNVGNQNVDADTEDVDDSYDDHNAFPGDHDVSGNTYNEDTFDDAGEMDRRANDSVNFSNQTFSDGASLNLSDFGDFFDEAPNKHWVFRVSATSNDTNQEFEIFAEISGIRVYKGVHQIPQDGKLFVTAPVLANVPFSGNSIDVTITNISGQNATLDGVSEFEVYGEETHFHDLEVNQPSINDGAEPRDDGSTNDTNPIDSSAGDTTSLNATGSTDAKNINTATEDKTDR